MKIWLARVETKSKGGSTSVSGDFFLRCLTSRHMSTPGWQPAMVSLVTGTVGARFWFTKAGWIKYGKPCVELLKSCNVRLTVRTVRADSARVALLDKFQALYPMPNKKARRI